MLDRYPCYVNILFVCKDDARYPQAPTDSKYLNAGGKGIACHTYDIRIHKYILTYLGSYHRNVGYQAISLLFSFPCQAILVLPRPCFVFCSGCWKRLPVCEKRRRVAMLCVGRQLHRRVLFNCNAWKILEDFVKGHKRGG